MKAAGTPCFIQQNQWFLERFNQDSKRKHTRCQFQAVSVLAGFPNNKVIDWNGGCFHISFPAWNPSGLLFTEVTGVVLGNDHGTLCPGFLQGWLGLSLKKEPVVWLSSRLRCLGCSQGWVEPLTWCLLSELLWSNIPTFFFFTWTCFLLNSAYLFAFEWHPAM